MEANLVCEIHFDAGIYGARDFVLAPGDFVELRSDNGTPYLGGSALIEEMASSPWLLQLVRLERNSAVIKLNDYIYNIANDEDFVAPGQSLSADRRDTHEAHRISIVAIKPANYPRRQQAA